MSKVRRHEPSSDGEDTGSPVESVALRPLRVSGIVVRKADLIEALRVYVPGLVDLQVTEDSEHFWLLLRDAEPAPEPARRPPDRPREGPR